MAETSQFVATFVLNCLWQVLLVAAAAALGAKLLRRTSSAHRHLVWLAALALCLALPLGSARRLVGEVQSGHASAATRHLFCIGLRSFWHPYGRPCGSIAPVSRVLCPHPWRPSRIVAHRPFL